MTLPVAHLIPDYEPNLDYEAPRIVFYPLTSVSMFRSLKVYVCWVEIAYSLVWSLIVPVVDEFIVGWEHPGFGVVGFVEGFYLAYG